MIIGLITKNIFFVKAFGKGVFPILLGLYFPTNEVVREEGALDGTDEIESFVEERLFVEVGID